MTLATRCTACGTAFRVVEDQLKVSGGWVRCGSCHAVFDAAENLFGSTGGTAVEADAAPSADSPVASRPHDGRDTDAILDERQDADARTDGDASAAGDDVPASTSTASPGVVDQDGVDAAVPNDGGPAAERDPDTVEQPAESPVVLDGHAGADLADVAHTSATAPPGHEIPALQAAPSDETAAQDHRPDADSGGLGEAFDTTLITDSRPSGDADDSRPAALAGQGTVAGDGDEFRDSRIDDHLFGVRRAGSRRTKPAHVNERDRLDFSDARFDSDLMAYDEEPATEDAPGTVDPPTSAIEPTAPEFMRKDEPPRWHGPRLQLGLTLGVVALGLSLVLQWVHHFRDGAAVRWPGLRPALTQWCAMAGCTLEPPQRIDAISVESTALSKAPGTEAFRLAIGLRNRGSVPVSLPWIDLSLTDGAGQLVARKALPAAEFKPGSSVLQPGADILLQTLLSARNLQVTGYTVEIFYP